MRIVHVFREPMGGLFRHVLDLVGEQVRAGHEVGLICAGSGGETAGRKLAEISPKLKLGVTRLPMSRLPGPADLEALSQVRAHVRDLAPHILHGHGAKGGLYARLATGIAGGGPRVVYTPHGGSLHYSWRSPAGALFLLAERWLLRHTHGLVFVCEYERNTFFAKIARPSCPVTVVHNGLREEEFVPVPAEENAADVLFIGELRMLKGVDVLIEAIARLHAQGQAISALIVGEGPDRNTFAELISKHGLDAFVAMPGAMPARRAFRRGRVVVVPSRAESFPYVVLEAQAAGKPVIASRVGGIPEMLPADALVPPNDAATLAKRILATLHDPRALDKARARAREMEQRFSVARMAQQITDFYRSLLPATP